MHGARLFIYFVASKKLKLMKRYRLFLLAFAVALLLVSCGEQRPTQIKIVCTGDVHGHLFPYDSLTGDSVGGSLARVSSYLKEQRRQGGNVIYIDNGDMLQGTPATYCYTTYYIGQTHVAAEALNYLQCDAVILGNNDIEPGGPTYQRYIDDLACPMIGGNIEFRGTETPFLPPYTIVEREGVKVAILGLTTPAIPHWVPKCQWPELEFEDMERSASRWMKHLQENASPDIVIGLFHSGYEGGIVTDDYAENASRAVAERVPGFDAVFYGHDHKPRTTKVVNVEGDTVLLLNPGKDAQRVAVVDVLIDNEGNTALEASLVGMEDCIIDEEYIDYFASHIERIGGYLDRAIGVSDCMATPEDALFGPSAFMDFIHQMQLDVTGAKISFAAPLVYDALPEGELKVRDIYRLYPYENNLYVLWLTGREIKNYLEMSYGLWTTRMSSSDDHLLLLDEAGNRLKYPYFYFDSAAGIIYEVDVAKPIGDKVSIKHMADGTPFRMDERYMVAMNSYRAHGGGGLLTSGAGITHEQLHERTEYATTADLRFYMLNYIEMRDSISPKTLNQWRFVPERWTVGAGLRDRELLFGKE